MLVPVDRLQPVFLNPVRDSRLVAPKPAPDLLQRQSLTQELLERRAVHAPIFLTAWDGTLERLFA
jgi:hypothetical protein